MKHLFRISFIFLVSLLLCGCGDGEPQFIAVSDAMLGSTVNVKAEISPRRTKELVRGIKSINEQVIREMSIFDPNSILSQINRGERDDLTPWIEYNLRLADSISRLSRGTYDVTVAPLVKAWGFARSGASATTIDPTTIEVPNVDSLLQLVGYHKISIVDGKLRRSNPNTQIDLNSIAKGFAVDKVAELIESLGGVNYIVEVGGELRFGGCNPSGGGWRIGVETPVDETLAGEMSYEKRLEILHSNPLRAMATSGNYRRFYNAPNGDRIVHVIDPRTGRGAPSKLLSVTVLARSCAEADAYATMLLAAGDRGAERLARQIDGCEVYLIYSDDRAAAGSEGSIRYRDYASPGMRGVMMKD
ncbi:MAG: FAD:protein FMN transferase [Rikenellaceae bacterium]